ncbi:tripartite tricarboxylate transporter TctB family protein [Halomonas dongshanensis]|uniref:Tripartite tricarboxylate transporter TctB family protein n=1 Tax=Halomonas dongshanensis TaxID=2890835 RepID=A0ABT2EBZ3_9GAMM|nr:tripartite tricarboxylate transporter TctB family protein [Halomonas dongshanensis]MCS2608615.1 tripartite tricarboxylate transporter TctB family protein [Halomonas dongshanensis]
MTQRDIGKPLFNVVLIIVSASVFVAASAFPNVNIPGDLSAAFFPQLLSALIFIFAIPCLIKDFQEWRTGDVTASSSSISLARAAGQWLFVILLLIAYVYAFERLGYMISTALFIFFCVVGLAVLSGTWGTLSIAGKSKALAGALVFAVVLAVAIFYVFTDLFKIPLPT